MILLIAANTLLVWCDCAAVDSRKLQLVINTIGPEPKDIGQPASLALCPEASDQLSARVDRLWC